MVSTQRRTAMMRVTSWNWHKAVAVAMTLTGWLFQSNQLNNMFAKFQNPPKIEKHVEKPPISYCICLVMNIHEQFGSILLCKATIKRQVGLSFGETSARS